MVVILIACICVAVGIVSLYRYVDDHRISPDGDIYLQAANGMRVPRPFHLRVLMPWFCGLKVSRWDAAAFVGYVVAAVAIGAIAAAKGQTASHAITATALFAGLPMVRSGIELPVLVDGPAIAFAAVTALAVVTGAPAIAIVLVMVGASVKETVPIFAALAAWSWIPLVGLAVPILIWLVRKPAATSHPSQATPLAYARERQRTRFLVPGMTLLPWGACLAVLFAPTAPVIASLGAGYGLMLTSADCTRIYQWAAIPVCISAAATIPDGWLLPAVVAHLFNPWRGEL